MAKPDSQAQPEPNPCMIYMYSPPAGFELFSSMADAQQYLTQQEYTELPGAYGIISSYSLPENTRLAHRYAVLISHPEQDYLFLLREYQFSEFMQKIAPSAPIIKHYLPIFQGQAMLPKLSS
jgi:hypothetical protein